MSGNERHRPAVTGDARAAVVRVGDPADLAARMPGIVEVYRAAFAGPPHGEGEDDVVRFRDEQLPRHLGREDLTVATASISEEVVGFAYGYTGRRGQFWSDLLLRSVPEDVTDRWVGGHFEVVTLAVDPRVQRGGIGTRLMHALLDAVPHERALLGGPAVDSPARRLYLRLGWTALADFGQTTLFGLERPSTRQASEPRATPVGEE